MTLLIVFCNVMAIGHVLGTGNVLERRAAVMLPGSEIMEEMMMCSVAVSISVTGVSCNGRSDGAVLANASGGIPPYAYYWTGGGLDTAVASVTALKAGTYNLTVIDSSDCTIMEAVTVVEPNPLKVLTSVTDVSCKGEKDGRISFYVLNGTAPYTSTPLDLASLSAGNQSLTVTDSNGCEWSDTLTIEQPDSALELLIKVNHESCTNCSDGAVLGNAKGGTPPYFYSGELRNLDSGAVYYVNITVTDSRGCRTAKSASGTIMPVDLSSFVGSWKDQRVLLEWTTESEENNAGFEVQHKREGDLGFNVLGFVSGNGTVLTRRDYQFVHKAPRDIGYYRLKQMDLNGRYEYSKTIVIDPESDNSRLIYIEVEGVFLYLKSAVHEPVDALVFDHSGRVMHQFFNIESENMSQLGMASGAYTVLARSRSGLKEAKRFTIH